MPATRRTQLLMDPKEFRRLRAIARKQKTSVAELIRSAVREVYLKPQLDRKAIVRKIANMNLPTIEWDEARREIEAAHTNIPGY